MSIHPTFYAELKAAHKVNFTHQTCKYRLETVYMHATQCRGKLENFNK